MKKLFTLLPFCFIFSFFNSNAQPVHKVLIEEFTTASCGNCPMMSQYIRTWHEANEANSIMVSIHEGSGVDAMSSSTTAAIFNAMHPSGGWFAPAVMIERAIYPSTGGEAYLSCYQSWGSPNGPGIDTIATRLMSETAIVDIEISGTYNSTTRMLDATVSANFLQSINAGDWRINLFLVEDSVVGWPGLGAFAGWDQHCYDANWANTYYPGMFDGTSIIGYPHRHVMRNSFFGNWGAAGIIPSVPLTGTSYSTSASITVDTAYHDNHLSLVAFVSSYGATKAEKFVLNANDIKVGSNFATAIPIASQSAMNGTLYPVPSTGIVYLLYSSGEYENVKVNIADASGRLLKTIVADSGSTNSHEISFSTEGFSKGVYFVTVSTKKGNAVNRIVVE
ncbi:MAG: Omp28-related outer membrane protein [Bacteroidetes bacterium]|nr:Omp28-related outer membrane protein [Bacteroidota bacterium]